MTIEPSEEAKRKLSPEKLALVRKLLAEFEVQAAKPRAKLSERMPKDKTDFPIGLK